MTDKALSNGAIRKLILQVSGRISVLMSTFSVFWLSYGRPGNEFCAEEGQNPIFDPLPRNEKLCGNLYRKFALRNGLGPFLRSDTETDFPRQVRSVKR